MPPKSSLNISNMCLNVVWCSGCQSFLLAETALIDLLPRLFIDLYVSGCFSSSQIPSVWVFFFSWCREWLFACSVQFFLLVVHTVKRDEAWLQLFARQLHQDNQLEQILGIWVMGDKREMGWGKRWEIFLMIYRISPSRSCCQSQQNDAKSGGKRLTFTFPGLVKSLSDYYTTNRGSVSQLLHLKSL